MKNTISKAAKTERQESLAQSITIAAFPFDLELIMFVKCHI